MVIYTLEQAMSPEGEWGYNSTLSLTSAIEGVGSQRHAPTTLSPGERACTHCTGGWVSSRAGLGGFDPRTV